jgi:hypothetical protein
VSIRALIDRWHEFVNHATMTAGPRRGHGTKVRRCEEGRRNRVLILGCGVVVGVD